MAALPRNRDIPDNDSSEQPPSTSTMAASDGEGLPSDDGRPPMSATPSPPPTATAALPPAVAYVEAIRRSMPPTQRLVTAEELATLREWQLVNASPTVSAWMAPVSPNEPGDLSSGDDGVDDSLLAGLSALSLDAAHATDSDLRAVMALPVKAPRPAVADAAAAVPREPPATPPLPLVGTS